MLLLGMDFLVHYMNHYMNSGELQSFA